MFNAILWMQWKSTRAMALLMTLLAFALPLASMQATQGLRTANLIVDRMQAWGGWYVVLSALVGLMIALAAWRADHAGRHVYALSLPIARRNYVLYRFTAGLLFLIPAIVALLVGCLLVAAAGTIPDGLHAYPVALTMRFALASLTAYALFFAIAASTSRTAGYILAAMAGLVFAQFLIGVLGDTNVNIITPILDFIFYRPGLLSVFSGRWMLVDV